MIELAIIAIPFTLLALAGSIAFLGIVILIKEREDERMEVIGRTSLIVEVKPGVYYGKHILGDPLFKLTDNLKLAKKFELTDTQKAQNAADLVFGKVKKLTIKYTLEDEK